MKPTLTVREAATLLGISASSAYEAARKNKFPVPVIRVGGRIVVPAAPLLDLLGIDSFEEVSA